jgi:hypothetical protein
MQSALAWCKAAALLSGGTSAVAIGTHHVIAFIVLAAFACVSVVAVCMTAVVLTWNRDTATIDARTRAKSLRILLRKARTHEERERAAKMALAPMILSGDGRSCPESLQNALLPPAAPEPGSSRPAQAVNGVIGNPSGREADHRRPRQVAVNAPTFDINGTKPTGTGKAPPTPRKRVGRPGEGDHGTVQNGALRSCHSERSAAPPRRPAGRPRHFPSLRLDHFHFPSLRLGRNATKRTKNSPK